MDSGLIWVNTLGVCLTPNYQVQKLFATNPAMYLARANHGVRLEALCISHPG